MRSVPPAFIIRLPNSLSWRQPLLWISSLWLLAEIFKGKLCICVCPCFFTLLTLLDTLFCTFSYLPRLLVHQAMSVFLILCKMFFLQSPVGRDWGVQTFVDKVSSTLNNILPVYASLFSGSSLFETYVLMIVTVGSNNMYILSLDRYNDWPENILCQFIITQKLVGTLFLDHSALTKPGHRKL